VTKVNLDCFKENGEDYCWALSQGRSALVKAETWLGRLARLLYL